MSKAAKIYCEGSLLHTIHNLPSEQIAEKKAKAYIKQDAQSTSESENLDFSEDNYFFEIKDEKGAIS